MVGGAWNGFLPGKVKGETVPCRFCGGPDGHGHLFGDCSVSPLVSIRENPECHELSNMDKSQWPRCLLWHGWLKPLSGGHGTSPWAETEEEVGRNQLETSILILFRPCWTGTLHMTSTLRVWSAMCRNCTMCGLVGV